MAQKSPEQRKSYHVTKAFKGLNTRANRTALDSDEFAWLENAQPIGFGNIKIVPTSSNLAVSWANTVTQLSSCNINNVDYIFAFQANGGCEYYRLDTLSKGTVAPAGTFSGSGMRLRQWKNDRAIIIDPNNGYYTWDTKTYPVFVGSIGSIGITNPGSGYTEPPVITISAPNDANGVTATALAQISNAAGTIVGFNITSGGTGYTSFPSVTIGPPPNPGGVQATAYVGALSGNSIVSLTITNPGSGYVSAPSVTFSGGGGSGANIAAVVGSGLVTGITITEAGSGYTTAPTITFSGGGGGSGAAAVAGPLTFAKGALGILVVNGGSGYSNSSNTTVTIGAAPPGGTNATATSIVFGNSVTGIVVTNPGAGYTTAPTVTIGGTGSNASATALVTTNVNTDISSFQGRTWISQGRTVFYSAADTYNDFVSVSAGSIVITDDTLHSNISVLLSANNFLYVFGDDSINVFSDVRVGTNGVTSFTNTNVSASTGSTYNNGIFPYFRSLLFINQYGIFALVGATVTKISEALDGIIPLIDFTQPISGGQVLINNILCAAFNCYYQDPTLGTRPIQLVFFDKKWFITSQGTIKYVNPVATANKLWLYGTGGSDLYKLYNDSGSAISSTVKSALWPMEDTIRDKQALKFGIEATLSVSGSLLVTVDSENGSSPVYTEVNLSSWVNYLNNTIPWQNNSLAAIAWIGGYGYFLYKSDAQQYGKYLGLTITSQTPNFTLNTLEMEYELRARF
jgi:hypothetical protein